jgi:5-methylcytosine-specific restriction endonuclease McrA
MILDSEKWVAIFERDKGICQYCGVDLLSSFSSYWSATVDHIISRSSGGSDDESNLVLACPACNGILSRSNNLRTLEERKEKVRKRIKEKYQDYEEWVNELRQMNSNQKNSADAKKRRG